MAIDYHCTHTIDKDQRPQQHKFWRDIRECCAHTLHRNPRLDSRGAWHYPANHIEPLGEGLWRQRDTTYE